MYIENARSVYYENMQVDSRLEEVEEVKIILIKGAFSRNSSGKEAV